MTCNPHKGNSLPKQHQPTKNDFLSENNKRVHNKEDDRSRISSELRLKVDEQNHVVVASTSNDTDKENTIKYLNLTNELGRK